jgi:pimeloyl-ACP methyl ester carboxylesterase
LKRTWRYLLLGVLSLLILVSAGFVLWAANPSEPEEQALNRLISDQDILVQQQEGWLMFSPSESVSQTGLIFYPGARVDYRAYAPHASAIAEAGFTVVIIRMPLNFAFFGVNQASEVIAAYPEITRWAIGGHSLGGAMAAQFASDNLNLVDGLVLWASYPAGNNNLSETGLPVISVFASNDGLASIEEINASRDNLPLESTFIEIQGGNHAGFGWYGTQNGDGVSLISKLDQQNQITQATTDFLMTIQE